MSIYCEARNFAEKFIDPYSKKVDEEENCQRSGRRKKATGSGLQ